MIAVELGDVEDVGVEVPMVGFDVAVPVPVPAAVVSLIDLIATIWGVSGGGKMHCDKEKLLRS